MVKNGSKIEIIGPLAEKTLELLLEEYNLDYIYCTNKRRSNKTIFTRVYQAERFYLEYTEAYIENKKVELNGGYFSMMYGDHKYINTEIPGTLRISSSNKNLINILDYLVKKLGGENE
ncbi:hypothetical protein HN385_00220 [archaeon]|jgi:hypothetical protein|nr:hypothetical protein [archaeon]MBT5021673.1 hypothetical protein [Candidatus Woesearchaeota archaeon]MBT3451652.1 hypothetical protein [archaeon]MBT6869673.1 hypothetical protein [archaeon]MBT7192441.1 hypothetical protein [archaeon]